MMVATGMQEAYLPVLVRMVVMAVVAAQLPASRSDHRKAPQGQDSFERPLAHHAGGDQVVGNPTTSRSVSGNGLSESQADAQAASKNLRHPPASLDRAISSADLHLVPLAAQFWGDEVSGCHQAIGSIKSQ